MKSNLQKGIAAYSALAGSLLAAQEINAQIIYHNIPDVKVNADHPFYYLDLNGDGVVDYTIRFYNSHDQRSVAFENDLLQTSVRNFNRVVAPLSTSYYAQKLKYGAKIDANLNWDIVAYDMAFERCFSSNCGYDSWSGVKSGYAGLKFKIRSTIHYAWLRVAVDSFSRGVVIKDFAYQNTPNEFILAGDKGAGIVTGVENTNKAEEVSDLRIFPNPVSSALTIQGFNGSSDPYDFVILNMQGEIVKRIQNVTASESVSIDVHDLADGLYLLQIRSKGETSVLKFSVKK